METAEALVRSAGTKNPAVTPRPIPMTGLDLESFLLLLRADLSVWLMLGLAALGFRLSGLGDVELAARPAKLPGPLAGRSRCVRAVRDRVSGDCVANQPETPWRKRAVAHS